MSDRLSSSQFFFTWRALGPLLSTFLALGASGWAAAPYSVPQVHALGVSIFNGSATGLATAAPGDTVQINATTNSGGLPLSQVTLSFTNGDTYVSVPVRNGVTSFAITSSWPSGEYQLNTIAITDQWGGSSEYAASGALNYTTLTWLAPAAANIDLSQTRFTVAGTTSPKPPIEVLSISRTTPRATMPGTAVSYAFSLSAAPATRNYSVLLEAKWPSGRSRSLSTTVTGTDGIATITPAASWPNGLYTIMAWISPASPSGETNPAPSVYARYLAGSALFPSSLGFELSGAGVIDPSAIPALLAVSAEYQAGTFNPVVYLRSTTTPANQTTLFVYTDPAGFERQLFCWSGSANVSVFPSWINGPYQLQRVRTTDSTGNAAWYGRDGRVVGDGTTNPNTHQLDFSRADFSVTGGWDLPLGITAQPGSASVQPGDSATLSVTASAPANATYQWYAGASGDTSSPVTGATGSTFTVRPNSTATYWVRITTPGGSVDSAAATVTVAYTSTLPVFVTQPSAIEEPANTATALTAFVVGPGPLTYQWYKDDVAVTDATSARLSFASGQSSDSGTYVLKATNGNGTTASTAVKVSFIAAPVFTTRPVDQQALVGDTVTLTVAATGTPVFTWKKDGVAVSGASADGTLTLGNVQRSDEATYVVTATNKGGSVSASAIVRVTHRNAPVVTLPVNGLTAAVNERLSYQITAVDAERFTVTDLPPGLTLSEDGLISGTPSTAGAYNPRFVVSNSAGDVRVSMPILVEGPAILPSITSQPGSVNVPIGSNTSFSVTAAGTTPLTYQWFKDSIAIAGATGASLDLRAVQEADAGGYSVRVTNRAGSVTSNAARLTVYRANFSGSYFGTLGGSAGNWALYVRADNTAELLAYDRVNRQAHTTTFTLDGTGYATLPVAGATRAATSERRIGAETASWLRIDGTAVTGASFGASLAGVLDVSSAPTVSGTGLHRSLSVGSETGAATLIVGPSGRAFALVQVAGAGDALTGTLSPEGALSGVTETGGSATFALQGRATLVGTVTTAGATAPKSFLGMQEGVTPTAHLSNVSVRGVAGVDSSALIVGFSLAGQGQSRRTLVRGIGPALIPYGVANALADPQLRLFDAERRLLAENDNWGGGASTAALFDELAAFPLPGTSKDAVLVQPLAPGVYSAMITSAAGEGVALLEAYDADTGNTAELVNLSVRARAGIGDQTLTAGFYVVGEGPQRFLIRGVGPGLTHHGVSGTVRDPRITLRKGQDVVAENDNWGGSAELTAVFDSTWAFRLVEAADAAMVVTLAPGGYTVQLDSVSGEPGTALIEVYRLP